MGPLEQRCLFRRSCVSRAKEVFLSTVGGGLLPNGEGEQTSSRCQPFSTKAAVMQKIFSFADLSTTDLVVDARYCGGPQKNSGADPIHPLVGVAIKVGFVMSAVPPKGRFVSAFFTQI